MTVTEIGQLALQMFGIVASETFTIISNIKADASAKDDFNEAMETDSTFDTEVDALTTNTAKTPLETIAEETRDIRDIDNMETVLS